MRLALDLARCAEGRTGPNPPVGALIVVDGVIVGRGFHPRAGEPHAEVFALCDAAEQSRGADVYVTLEPCSHHGRTGPCCDALIAAGIRRVFIGMSDPNPLVNGRGVARLRAAGVEVVTGILEKECRHLIAPFIKHVTSGLPLVILKSAMTLDGKTATVTGDSQWITNVRSRLHVHEVRNRVDAILVGIGTVLADDPRLTTRLNEIPAIGMRDPLRVVLDASLRIPLTAQLLNLDSAASTLILTTGAAAQDKVEQLRALSGVEVEILPADDAGQVELLAALQLLGRRQVQSLLIEGGARIHQSFLQQRLIDRVMVYVAPKLLGGSDGQGLFCGPGPQRLAEALSLQELRTRRFDDDILIEAEVASCLPV
ncbi:MAG: bifunctional diaminohydroxyphosphoribosylaminopyrimidine deaminase/5-amino-6-(5-phosphoribosylamino)uracil reductase RibD [Desulfuromonadaceae bacterium]|nr:bifunctional diaminohydroxyphosphoribosylaminopyrimidine deaminase/5-amino-6-(5-phosphoribosylamino)uracil reductase RibD [Desulfuromonadaceae bacterium]